MTDVPLHRAWRLLAFATAWCMLAACAHQPAPAAKVQVIGWVPAYGMEPAMRALRASPGVGTALTRIGLQFWNPSADGRGVVFAPIDKTGQPVTPADVIRFRDWARAHDIQVLLTVYNNSQVIGHWDWPLARKAFVEQPAAFTQALIDEMDKYRLDGIDLDLEGEGDFDADRAAYASFVRGLSEKLKARGKLLTIDTFHSPCWNAPNMSWWADWRDQADAIHSMGYADLYEGSTEAFTPPGKPVCEGGAPIFKYSSQVRYGLRAGLRPEQIVLGLPTWVDTWGSGGEGEDAVSHLREVQAIGAGVALWDLQLGAPGWNTPATWEAVRAVREKPGIGWSELLNWPCEAAGSFERVSDERSNTKSSVP